MENKYDYKPNLSDKATEMIGSAKFIIWFAVFLSMWIMWNILPFTYHFDAQPFILLNLCLSFLAGFQAPVIMMSQNRAADRDRQVVNSIKHMVEKISHVLDSTVRVEKKVDKEVNDLIRKVEVLETQNSEMLELLQALHNKK